MQKEPRPVQLIYMDDNKQLCLGEEAAEIIKSFSEQCKHFAVVCVVGKYRTGKSYLVNQVLLQQNKGFNVGSTINACTKGLWMWSELIYFEPGKSKEPIPAILIDTEGIGSVEEEQNHDVKIFLLSILLSSYFIYNSVGNIDDMALQNLGLIVNLTKMLQKADETTQKDLFETFPSFLWILRDFTLRLEDEIGNKITPKEYLENALKPLKGFSEAIENKNKIRRHITQFFQERDCVTLVRPTQDEKDLQHLTEFPFESLRIEFQEQVLALRKKFSYKVQLKQYKGKPTTPYSFVEMIKHFVSTINEGNLPVIESQWQMICKQEINRTLACGVSLYNNLMLEVLRENGVTREHLESQHIIFARKVKQFLDHNCLDKDNEEYKQAKKSIKQQIEGLCQDALSTLDQKHEEQLEKIKVEFLQELSQLDQNDSTWKITDKWMEAQGLIWKSGASQKLTIEYQQSLQRAVLQRLQIEQSKLQHQLKFQVDCGHSIEDELRENKQRLKEQEDAMYEKITNVEKEKNQIRIEIESEKGKNLRLQQQLLQAQSSIDMKVNEYMAKFKQIEKSYNDQLVEKDQQINQLEQRLKTGQSEIEKHKALLKQQDQLHSQESSTFRRDIDRLKDELQDKGEMLTKLKQSIAEESAISYSSLQPRRSKLQNDTIANNNEIFQKEVYEFQITQYQQQLEEQKKLTQSLIANIQNPRNSFDLLDFGVCNTNNNFYLFMTLLHQLMGAYIDLQKNTRDENSYKKFQNLLKCLMQMIEEDQNGFALSERNNSRMCDITRLEKTMSSSSPKHSKQSLGNSQNINPFRSPDTHSQKSSKLTIMQMFMQQKNKEKELEKVKKSVQLENSYKTRNNIHLQRKVY